MRHDCGATRPFLLTLTNYSTQTMSPSPAKKKKTRRPAPRTSLLNLPNELLHKIATLLPTLTDFFNLRRTNKHLASITSNHVTRNKFIANSEALSIRVARKGPTNDARLRELVYTLLRDFCTELLQLELSPPPPREDTGHWGIDLEYHARSRETSVRTREKIAWGNWMVYKEILTQTYNKKERLMRMFGMGKAAKLKVELEYRMEVKGLVVDGNVMPVQIRSSDLKKYYLIRSERWRTEEVAGWDEAILLWQIVKRAWEEKDAAIAKRKGVKSLGMEQLRMSDGCGCLVETMDWENAKSIAADGRWRPWGDDERLEWQKLGFGRGLNIADFAFDSHTYY
ncbi:hypothetical protein BJ508DRAFT_315407 [Ascobolus immersus RN42]|uniref:F-box domain-containing protein n=1 Tax=Ascobolus immersus RN42 TaxID=1160509 RepID=A0A3N4HH57_ASCIM|nr:hypothetical protein BJ508DRAFT_315407 [Ascobolus immersus RN42]